MNNRNALRKQENIPDDIDSIIFVFCIRLHQLGVEVKDQLDRIFPQNDAENFLKKGSEYIN